MSLISEGLKKAQLDAMRQDREQRQAYLRSATSPAPQRSRSHVPQMIAVALVSAIIAIGAVLWFSTSKTPAVLTATQPPVVVDTKPAAATPVVTEAVVKSATDARLPEPAVPKKKKSVETIAAVTPPSPPPSLPAPEPVKESATKHRRDNFVEGETYASPINGPAGATVNLTGIMGAGPESLAIINGSTVHPGAMIGPFVVERVERHRVQLRYIDVHFYLTP